MEIERNDLEFDVLGFKVKVRPEENNGVPAERPVELVRQEAEAITKRFPQLDKGKVATLVALKLATDYLQLDQEFRKSIESLEADAQDALTLIQEAQSNP